MEELEKENAQLKEQIKKLNDEISYLRDIIEAREMTIAGMCL